MPLSIPFRIPELYDFQRSVAFKIFQFLSGFQQGFLYYVLQLAKENFQFLSGFQIWLGVSFLTWLGNLSIPFRIPDEEGLRPEFGLIIFQFLSGFQQGIDHEV